jgi:hypothetical protein
MHHVNFITKLVCKKCNKTLTYLPKGSLLALFSTLMTLTHNYENHLSFLPKPF